MKYFQRLECWEFLVVLIFDDVLLFLFHKNSCIIVAGDFLDVIQVIGIIQIIRSKFAGQLCHLTPLPAQISASNFHDLTQITQHRVCFNPKRTEKPKAHGFSVCFGLKHTLHEVVVVLIASITLRRGVI